MYNPYCSYSTNAHSAARGLAIKLMDPHTSTRTLYAAARAVLAQAARGINARQCNYARRVADAILRDDYRAAINATE